MNSVERLERSRWFQEYRIEAKRASKDRPVVGHPQRRNFVCTAGGRDSQEGSKAQVTDSLIAKIGVARDAFQALIDPAQHVFADIENYHYFGLAAVEQSTVEVFRGAVGRGEQPLQLQAGSRDKCVAPSEVANAQQVVLGMDAVLAGGSMARLIIFGVLPKLCHVIDAQSAVL